MLRMTPVALALALAMAWNAMPAAFAQDKPNRR